MVAKATLAWPKMRMALAGRSVDENRRGEVGRGRTVSGPLEVAAIHVSAPRALPGPSWAGKIAAGTPTATRYIDLGADWHDRRLNREAQTRRLVDQLQRLGHHVTLQPAETATGAGTAA